MHINKDNTTKQSYNKRLEGLQNGLYRLECCMLETPQTFHLSEEELWHKRIENLNYKALHLIGQQNLVVGIPKLQ
jgi:hypothetical protein